jgi:MbtH protein
MSQTEVGTLYKVVVNHEEQYSLWPADRGNPLGWRDAGKAGSRAECLAHVQDIWTDMRPLSLRRQMDSAAPTLGSVGTSATHLNASSG